MVNEVEPPAEVNMKRSEKTFLVEDLAARLKDAKSLVVVDYQGLPVRELNDLRAKIAEAGGKLIVVKNTLLKLALNSSLITHHSSLPEGGLTGPTAVVFAEEDEISPLQALGKSISERELPKLKFGIFNSEIYDADKLLTLSRLPGKQVLLGQLLGTIAGPKYALVGTLNGNLQRLIYILSEKSRVSENSVSQSISRSG